MNVLISNTAAALIRFKARERRLYLIGAVACRLAVSAAAGLCVAALVYALFRTAGLLP